MSVQNRREWLSALAVIAVMSAAGCEELWGGFTIGNQGYCPINNCRDADSLGMDPDGSAAQYDLAPPAASDLGSVVPAVVAVGTKGTILRRVADAWQPESSKTTNDFIRVHGSDAKHLFAVGKAGTILCRNSAARRCDYLV